MNKSAQSVLARLAPSGTQEVGTRPVYYISDRPEAYEIFGEVDHAAAKEIGRLIADHAARMFPGVDFKVDSGWHSHQRGMEPVAAYIEEHWQRWVQQRRP